MISSKFLLQLVLTFSLAGSVCVLSVSAQSGEFCGLTVQPGLDEGDKQPGAVDVTAIDEEIGRVYSSASKNGLPFLPKLPEGTYKLVLSKNGYKKTSFAFTLRCSEKDSDSSVTTMTIPMLKGNSTEYITLEARPIQLGNEDKPADPMPAPASPAVPKIVSKGVINGSAIYLAKPEYSASAKAIGATGVIAVHVTIDEAGNVISAVATGGHPLLKAASVDAAKASKFKPTLLEGVPVKVSGVVVYNFQ
jgi:hypothetical protein